MYFGSWHNSISLGEKKSKTACKTPLADHNPQLLLSATTPALCSLSLELGGKILHSLCCWQNGSHKTDRSSGGRAGREDQWRLWVKLESALSRTIGKLKHNCPSDFVTKFSKQIICTKLHIFTIINAPYMPVWSPWSAEFTLYLLRDFLISFIKFIPTSL